MAESCYIAADEIDDILVLVRTLAGDHMCEDILRLMAPHDEALDYHTLLPVLLELALAGLACLGLKLVALLEAIRRDEPVVDANAQDCMFTTCMSTTLFS